MTMIMIMMMKIEMMLILIYDELLVNVITVMLGIIVMIL